MLQGAGAALALGAFNALASLSTSDELRNAPASVFAVFVLALATGGAAGGGVYYATDPWRAQGGGYRTAANVISLLLYSFITIAVLLGAGGLVGF
jgi:hypothetical protein